MSRRIVRRPLAARVIALLACVLLLGLQHEGLRHGVLHLGERAAAHERALAAPTLACDECALLAGASAGLVGHTEVASVPGAHRSTPDAADVTVALAAPRRYTARAPPLRS